MKKTALLFFTVALILLTGCSGLKYNHPIIKVNDAVITEGMFNKVLAGRVKSISGGRFKLSDDNMLYLILKTHVVNELISRELIFQAAKKYNIVATKEEINKLAAKITSDFGGEEKLEQKLASNNVSKETFLKNVERQILVNKLAALNTKNIKITEPEMRDFYNKNKTTLYSNPDLVKAQHILVSVSEQNIKVKNPNLPSALIPQELKKELSEAKAKAEKILAKVKANPEKFGDLAKEYSDDTVTSNNNGDLGYFSKKDMMPAFSKAAFALKPGQISDIVKTDYGYHIIKVNSFKKANTVSFDSAKKDIQKRLISQAQKVELNKILKEQRKESKIVYLDSKYNPDLPKTDVTTFFNKLKK